MLRRRPTIIPLSERDVSEHLLRTQRRTFFTDTAEHNYQLTVGPKWDDSALITNIRPIVQVRDTVTPKRYHDYESLQTRRTDYGSAAPDAEKDNFSTLERSLSDVDINLLASCTSPEQLSESRHLASTLRTSLYSDYKLERFLCSDQQSSQNVTNYSGNADGAPRQTMPFGPADTSTLFRNVSELCSLTKRLKPPSPHHRVHTASNSQEQLLPTVNGSPQVVPSSTPRSVRLRPTQRLIPYRSQFVRYSFDVLNNASAVHVEPHDSEDDFNNNRTLLIAARIFDDELISTSSLRDINPAWSDSSASDLNRLCPATGNFAVENVSTLPLHLASAYRAGRPAKRLIVRTSITRAGDRPTSQPRLSVYNDGLPASSQPQTPEHLPEARHQSRYHPSYTAPAGCRGLTQMITPLTRRRSDALIGRPPGLNTPGLQGSYGGRENTGDEVLFDRVATRLWVLSNATPESELGAAE